MFFFLPKQSSCCKLNNICFLAFGVVFADSCLYSYDMYLFCLLIIYRMNPQNEAAKKGLERLEKQMKVCF